MDERRDMENFKCWMRGEVVAEAVGEGLSEDVGECSSGIPCL